MTERTKALLTERGLACFGMITRGMTHEINNVLATINEIAGLLDDYLAAAEEGNAVDFAKLRALGQRTSKQVERGEGYVRQLNRFAHTMDHPREVVELHDCLEAMVNLCQRLARLRKVTLTVQYPADRVALEGSAFEMQHLLFRTIELALVATPPGATVVARYEPLGRDVCISVTGSEPVVHEADLGRMEAVLGMLSGVLGGHLQQGVQEGRPVAIELVLPRALGSLWGESQTS